MRLNIFVDETGEFGFSNNSSRLYGISFTFHEQKDNISHEIECLNEGLDRLGYTDMIHMADLIMRRGDYSKFDINMQKGIFNAIYQFSRKAPIKFHTIIIDKKYTDSSIILSRQISEKINKMLKENEHYFKKFDKIVLYYDNGQEKLTKVIEDTFCRYDIFEHISDFNHKEKRLFQVSDMLTFVDKCVYKYKNNIKYSKGELYFFSNEDLRRIIKELDKKRL